MEVVAHTPIKEKWGDIPMDEGDSPMRQKETDLGAEGITPTSRVTLGWKSQDVRCQDTEVGSGKPTGSDGDFMMWNRASPILPVSFVGGTSNVGQRSPRTFMRIE